MHFPNNKYIFENFLILFHQAPSLSQFILVPIRPRRTNKQKNKPCPFHRLDEILIGDGLNKRQPRNSRKRKGRLVSNGRACQTSSKHTDK